EPATSPRPGLVQRAGSVPLLPRPIRGLEPKQAQDLLHRDPEAGMTRVHVAAGEGLTLQLDDAADLRGRFREAYGEIIECSAFVNWRRIEMGYPPVLAISFNK